MTYVAIVIGLAVAIGLISVLCAMFRVDFGEALRLHWRRGLMRGLGVWPLFGVVAIVALVADLDSSARILEFICPPGREAEVRRLMPRAIGVFVGAGTFVLGASVVLRAVLWTPKREPRGEEQQEEAEVYD